MNWIIIWTLSWELVVWIIYTWLFYAERSFVLLNGASKAPSTLVRFFWIVQALIALKNAESVCVAHWGNNTQDINFQFWFQIAIGIFGILLAMRALCLTPEHMQYGKQLDDNDEDLYYSKLSMQQFEKNQDEKQLQLEPKYEKTPEETASLFSILTFEWLTAMFKTGYSRALEMEDLNHLKGDDHAHETLKCFYKNWREQLQKARSKNANRVSVQPIQNVGNIQSGDKIEASGMNEPLIRQKSDQTTMPKQVKHRLGDGNPSLIWALLHSFGGPLFVAGPLKLIYDCFNYSGPVILSAYLRDAQKFGGSGSESVHQAYMYSALMFGAYMCGTIVLAQYFHRCFRFGMRVRAALMSACYDKALKLSQGAKSEKTSGEIMTMITVDVMKIRNLFGYCWLAISCPFQIAVALYLLYKQVSWSVFVGLGSQFIIIAPLMIMVGSQTTKLQKQVMKIRDKRMKVVNEVFGSIKIVKMYAWELSFGQKITGIRNEELVVLRCYVWWYVAMIVFWTFAPTLVSLASFVAYTAAGHDLDAEKAFTSIALFNLLNFPLSALPMVILAFVEAYVSFGRVSKFLCMNELDPDVIEYDDIEYIDKPIKLSKIIHENEEQKDNTDTEEHGQPVITLNNATFTWDDEKNQIALKDINVNFIQNTITMVIGETGSGKSALLRSILGELTKESGHIVYGKDQKVAYSSQVPWIQNATVRKNILFGTEFEQKRYDEVIEACALSHDLEILSGGDQTEIGEKGINLSGGQKSRISLARAVYSNSDIYIMDDPLSAVDSHVATHIFNECFIGLLKDKTIILATHAVSFLKYAHNILVMEATDINGATISMQGKLQKLMDANVNLTKFIIHKDDEKKEDDDENNDDEKTDVNELLSPKNLEKQISKDKDKKDAKDKEKEGKLMDDEERGIGKVTAAVYMLYVSASGGIPLLLIYIFFVIIWAAVGLIGTFWLAKWANAMAETHRPHSSWWYLDFFMIIKFSTIFVSVGSGTTSLIMRLKASKFLHEKLLDKMLKSPMSFFDTTPIGRIINRFSRDVYSVDSAVPGSYTNTISIFIGLVSAAIGVGIATPVFAISLIPLSIIYYYIQKYFIATSRELRRLSTLMNSPIYSNYNESIAGSLIIRSFNKTQEFSSKNKTMIDKDHQAYYASVASNRWLAIRLEFIGNCLIGFTALSCAITRPSAGLVGVALSIVMSITQYLNWFVRSKAQLEQDIVAVERIDQYSNEETLQEKDNNIKAPANWPNKGEISFNNIHMKYRDKLPFVLKGLTFDIKGGEKIGVIGRTGAGKTSLFVTLLRLVELNKGEIIIDNINISNICLYDLRSKISVIPQDPTLFTGTVRFNLDPFKERNDDELIESLKLSHCLNALKKMIIEVTIKKEKDEEEKKRKEEEEKANKKKKKKNKNKKKEIIEKKENIKPKEEESVSKSIAINVSAFMNRPKYKDLNPLDLEVEENGSNFSVGQRQLLCLARAIVRKSKILLLDEATSAVDHQTDQLIQETIRDVFKNNTILTIAHRINTILDYDRILIMENGNVLEFDTVSSLLQNKDSKFSDIVQTSFGVNIEDVINSKINKQNKNKNKTDMVINENEQLQQDDGNKT